MIDPDKIKSIYENGKHIVFENVDHQNDDGTWGMKSVIVAEFYDLEAHNQFMHASELLEALEEIINVAMECDPRIIDLVGRLRFQSARDAIAKARGESHA